MSDARRRIRPQPSSASASKGYAATTIADIERSRWVERGRRRHLPTFRVEARILEAVVDMAVGVPDDEIAPPSDDLEATADAMLDYMRTEMVRIFLRDLDESPEQRKRSSSARSRRRTGGWPTASLQPTRRSMPTPQPQ